MLMHFGGSPNEPQEAVLRHLELLVGSWLRAPQPGGAGAGRRAPAINALLLSLEKQVQESDACRNGAVEEVPTEECPAQGLQEDGLARGKVPRPEAGGVRDSTAKLPVGLSPIDAESKEREGATAVRKDGSKSNLGMGKGKRHQPDLVASSSVNPAGHTEWNLDGEEGGEGG